MESVITHTPTPWRVLSRGEIVGPDCWTIAEPSATRAGDERLANAAYIVRAVNAHAGLVTMLNEAILRLEMAGIGAGTIADARAALALAEETS